MKKTFLYISITLFVSATFFSCGNAKEVMEETTEEVLENTDTDEEVTEDIETVKDEIKDTFTQGVVIDKSSTEGCGFVIQITLDEKQVNLEPLSLADEFKVNGLEVEIDYEMSRRATKCIGALPVTINSIQKK